MPFRPRERRIVGWIVMAFFVVGSLLVLNAPMSASVQTSESGRPASPEIDLEEIRIRTRTKIAEMRLGRQATRRFERRVRLVTDVAVVEYVDRIAQNLAGHSDATIPITIKVVDSEEVNAVSFPGGFLYVSTGLILAMDDAAGIASVIAHEIAHVVARDGMRNNRYLGTAGGPDTRVMQLSDSTHGTNVFENDLPPLVFLGSQLEIDADSQAIRYMQQAGYDPNALVGFLDKLYAKEVVEQEGVLLIFQTYPATAERIRLAQEQISASPSTQSSQTDTTGELQNIKTLLMEYEANRPVP